MLLNLLYLLFAALLFVQPAVGILGIVVCMLAHILTYFREKKVIEPYITSFAYVLRMIDVCEELGRQKIPVYQKRIGGFKRGAEKPAGIKTGFLLGNGRKSGEDRRESVRYYSGLSADDIASGYLAV